MIAFIWLISVAVILTKGLDCITTQRKIQSVHHESNPIGRWLMSKLGVVPAIWATFVIAVVLVAISHVWLVRKQVEVYDLVYILIGGLVAVIQAGVAHNNHTGRPNAITRWVTRWMQR